MKGVIGRAREGKEEIEDGTTTNRLAGKPGRDGESDSDSDTSDASPNKATGRDQDEVKPVKGHVAWNGVRGPGGDIAK